MTLLGRYQQISSGISPIISLKVGISANFELKRSQISNQFILAQINYYFSLRMCLRKSYEFNNIVNAMQSLSKTTYFSLQQGSKIYFIIMKHCISEVPILFVEILIIQIMSIVRIHSAMRSSKQKQLYGDLNLHTYTSQVGSSSVLQTNRQQTTLDLFLDLCHIIYLVKK